MEKDDYLQKLQRTMREHKHSKTEVRELVSLKRTLKAKVSTLALQLQERDISSSDEVEASGEFSELQEKVKSSEDRLEAFSTKVNKLEMEKQRLVSQLNKSLLAKEELIGESRELTRKLDTALKLCATTTEHPLNRDSGLEDFVSMALTDTAETQTDSVSYHDSQTQVDCASEFAEKEVQVDTLTEVCAQFRFHSEETAAELSATKEEITRSNKSYQNKLKDAESKIHQLLDIKEQLTKKNDGLRKRIDEQDLHVTRNSALHNTEISQQISHIVGREDSEPTSERLKKALVEMEEMKKVHLNERHEMRQRLADAIVKVKEREAKNLSEINDLKLKLDLTQKQLLEAATSTKSAGGSSIPDSHRISFREVESVTPYKLDEGTFGSTVEAVFRGKRVAARCVTKESLARYPIQTIHKQINAMALTRHPNLLLFIAVAMDAPSGIMILTELLTCTLREAYESSLIKPDKLPVLLDVALALNFMHLEKSPIVHGNLSSRCVLVEEVSEGQWRGKLSDIGTSASIMMLSAPRERERVYLAPELEGNSQHISSTPADLFSYGVLLCELASGGLPASAGDLEGNLGGLKGGLPQIACLALCCTASNPCQRPVMGNMVKKISNLVVNKIQVP